MFPFWMNPCCHSESQKSHRRHQLEFLKWMRDSLETRLAAVNAAIATMERQMNEENASNQAS
ncbi:MULTISPECIES: hypothetical protein [unclassified Anabaena]|uniref:hypothetical protein n=1 Tax=unclassified Anabaena TaxID=2619674 RepID=UPI00083645A5|nr:MULTISPECIES: hypothetical protein [unclassified Anabaena]